MTTMCARASFARARPVTGRATTTKTTTTQASTMRGESHPLVRSSARVGPRAPCARAMAIARGGGLSSTSTRARAVVARAEGGERDGGGRGKGFVGGILLGGAVFGALGFLFAPQLSKTLLGGKRAVNKMLDEESEDELEVTRQNLNEKIAALNAAIDNFSKEAEGGLEKNMNKLNEELNSLEKREVREA